MPAKKCTKCGSEQHPSAFAPTYRGYGKTALRAVCNQCERDRKKAAYHRRKVAA